MIQQELISSNNHILNIKKQYNCISFLIMKRETEFAIENIMNIFSNSKMNQTYMNGMNIYCMKHLLFNTYAFNKTKLIKNINIELQNNHSIKNNV